MSYSIVTVGPFEKELKHLAKKFPSIKKDLVNLVKELMHTPTLGTPLGNDCYKIRMAITSKGRGKSAGARIITHIRVSREYLYMLSIYDKSEAENISDVEISKRLSKIL